MPFRGETGGVGAGQGMGEVPPALGRRRRDAGAGARSPRRRAARSRSTRRCSAGSTRPAGPRPSTAPTSPTARRQAPRNDPARAVTPARASRPSAARATSRRPTTSPATTSCSASGSTSTCPGPSTATSGRPTLKATVDMEPLRPPAQARRRRRRACARASTTEVARAGPALAGSTSSSSRSRRWRGSKAGEPIPYLDQVERCLTPAPGARGPTRHSSGPRATLDALLPGHGSLADRLAAEDAAWTVPIPSASPAVVERARRRGSASARGALYGLPERRGPARVARPRPAVVRLQLVRRRLPLAGRPQPRPPDPPPARSSAPWPTRPTPATTSSTRPRSGCWSRSSGASSRRSC